MYSLDEAYNQKFFAKRKSLEWRVPIMCEAVTDAYPDTKSLIDFGCGNADLVRGFLSRGIQAYGIEGTRNCTPYIQLPYIDDEKEHLSVFNRVMIHDLRTPIHEYFDGKYYPHPTINIKTDLAICLEVAEHLEEEYANELILNIINVSDNVIFTAASPSQLGHYHVNLRPLRWWIEYFESYNYEFDYMSYHIMRHKLEQSGKSHIKGIKAWYTNLMCFKKKE